MRVSVNTIKQYTTIDLSVDELVARINAQLGGVEEVIDLAERYEKAVVVKIITAEQHPNADRLRVCAVDDGGVVDGIDRDEQGYVQVVCGAPNARAGIFAVWLPPKSAVPASFGDGEPFVLDSRELRGVVSHGMLAAADELAIGSDHEGILEIDPSEWKPNDVEIKPGASFARAYGLDDTLIDIENKMFTHRPDLFGQLGVAREIAGIQHKAFISPDWYTGVPTFNDASGLELEVTNEATEQAPRFMAVSIRNVTVKPSPLWLQCELVRLGGKPINNIVDATNYVMLLTSQPTHAYDYDKLRGGMLGVRMAKAGEQVTLLNDKTYTLDASDIVIVDGEGPVGLAGIMGGGNSEVSNETKNIVLEVANFDMYTVRRSSMRHGLFTDALTRFNKGQSPLQNPYILNLLMRSVIDVAGGEQASVVYDHAATENFMVAHTSPVSLDEAFINDRLGLTLERDDIKQLLENVECIVSTDAAITVTPPFWRTDIQLAEDVVEEIGRLYGFDRLPRELPRRSAKPAPTNQSRLLQSMVRDRLSRAGANEALTYSFVHENIIRKAGQDVVHAYGLSNALSPDLQYYRLSLTPSLLDKVHMNVKAGFGQFALFEINKVHYKGEMDPNEPTVPNEDAMVALTVAYDKKNSPAGSPYYAAKAYLERLIDMEAVEVVALSTFDLLTDEWGRQLVAPFEPERSAVIVRDGAIWGVIGEYKQAVKRSFKLPEYAAGFEVHQDVITAAGLRTIYKPLSRFPSTERDICFRLADAISYGELVATVKEAVGALEVETYVSPVDIYQAADDSFRNITVRVKLTSHTKTLTSDEVNSYIEGIAAAVIAHHKAEII